MRLLMTQMEPMIAPRRPERPLFAIGDIHGYSAPFEVLLAHLDRHIAATYPGRDVDLVYLGDLVDRGPDPLGVLRLARAGLGRDNVRETALFGNHDVYLMSHARLAGRRPSVTEWAGWMAYGGKETLAGMGLNNPLTVTAAQLSEALGPELCAFLEGLQSNYRSGEIFCAHAGVDPSRDLDEQIERDLIWIREPFLELAADAEAPWTLGVTIVHGHTPSAFGGFAHRIGVDSGGYATGVFSAVELWDGAYRFHHVDTSGQSADV